MNERFYELPEEKRHSIMNAAMEVFSANDYKKASTDLIAAKAGVSKGLLFYYFHNKKELYLAVYEYAKRTITEGVVDARLLEITDFFELITYATMKKVRILMENPYILDFSVRSFYSNREDISDDLKTATVEAIGQNYDQYFRRIDFSKFKKGVDPSNIFQMMIWLTDGYIHQQQMHQKPLSLEAIDREFANWTAMFKQIAYKEAYL